MHCSEAGSVRLRRLAQRKNVLPKRVFTPSGKLTLVSASQRTKAALSINSSWLPPVMVVRLSQRPKLMKASVFTFLRSMLLMGSPMKQLASTVSTVLDRLNVASCSQLAKALSPRVFTPSGSEMDFNDTQQKKALAGMVARLRVLKVRRVAFTQPWKAASPSSVTEAGMVMLL